jgi:hypothetical protein
VIGGRLTKPDAVDLQPVLQTERSLVESGRRLVLFGRLR